MPYVSAVTGRDATQVLGELAVGHAVAPYRSNHLSIPSAPPMQDIASKMSSQVSLPEDVTKTDTNVGYPAATAQQFEPIASIEYSELQVEKEPMAHGSFKKVFSAVWKSQRPGQPEGMKVAVLVLQSGQSMTSEVKIFERLGRHPHICRLLALTKQPPANLECMVMEFAQRGSLDVVLQDMDADGAESPSSAVLLTAATQV